MFAVRAQNHVIGLRIDPEPLVCKVSVDLADAFEHAARFGGHPFVFGQFLFVVRIERHDHEIVPQQLQHLRIGPYASLHFPAVDAPVTRIIDKKRLMHFAGIGQRLVVVEKAVQSVR